MFFSSILRFVMPVQFLIKVTGRKLLLPFYHTVSDSELPHIKHLYRVKSIKEFERELDFLLKYFIPISAEDLTNRLHTRQPIDKNTFLLSFDDGLREMYDIVFPILKRKGIPALFFLNSAFVDNKDLFFRYKASILCDNIPNFRKSLMDFSEKDSGFNGKSEQEIRQWLLQIQYSDRYKLDQFAQNIGVDFSEYLVKQKPYLTSVQVSEMTEAGFDFGAHSIDHPFFSELSLTEQLRQANESIQFVTEEYEQKHSYFSFPFFDNDVTKTFFTELYNENNRYKPDLIFGSSGMKMDEFPFVLHRLSMEKSKTSGANFIYVAYLKFLIKVILHKNYRNHPL